MRTRALTRREKRMLCLGTAAAAVYLAGFYGWRGIELAEGKRREHEELRAQAQALEVEILREQIKGEKLAALRQKWRLDSGKLQGDTLVGDARAAIALAAQACGLKLGSSKETPARASERELALLELEGSGTTSAAMQFLHRLPLLGYPLVVEAVNLKATPVKPGQVLLALNIAVLNAASWGPGNEGRPATGLLAGEDAPRETERR